MEGIQTFKGSWPWPWPWIRPYGVPSCIIHRPLPVYQISLKSKKLFVDGRTDGRTYGRTYGRTFSPPLILLGRLLEVDLINEQTNSIYTSSADVNRVFQHQSETYAWHSQRYFTRGEISPNKSRDQPFPYPPNQGPIFNKWSVIHLFNTHMGEGWPATDWLLVTTYHAAPHYSPSG